MSMYSAKDLARSFRLVRSNTLEIAREIPEEHYSFVAAPGVKSLGGLLTHIAVGPWFQLDCHMSGVTDLQTVNFPALMQKLGAEEAKPRTKADVIAFLESEGERFATWVEGLSDEFLAQQVTMMPGSTPTTKTRFEMLLSPKEHEMHHRGQVMLMQRMLGMTPPLTRAFQARMAARAAQQK